MSKIDWRDLTIFIVVIVIFVWALSLWTYNSFLAEPKNDTIKFEITGIVNNTNATSLSQIHFECIKYCIAHVDTSYNKLNSRSKE